MKDGKSILNYAVVAVLLPLCLILFSFNSNSRTSSNQKFTGKELMAALYFMNGEATNRIDPLDQIRLKESLTSDQYLKMTAQVSQFLDDYEKANPGSFESFKKMITSGDHALIATAIDFHADELFQHFVNNSNCAAETVSSLIIKNVGIDTKRNNELSAKPEHTDYFQGLDVQLGQKVNEHAANLRSGQATNIVAEVVIFDGKIVEGPADICWVVDVHSSVNLENVFTQIWGNSATTKESLNSKGTLMREQIVNSIALRWRGV